MAVGGAGCRIIHEFAASDFAKNFKLLAVDSDLEALDRTGLPDDAKIQAGRLWRSGLGCGGDEMAGQLALANERKRLNDVLSDTRILLIVAGLGGGLATGGLAVILGVAAKLHITTLLLGTLPFAMEGFQRRKLADDKVKSDFLPLADAVITLPNDLLFMQLSPDTPLHDAFKLSDQEMARSLASLATVLGGGNLFSADFAAVTGVLKRRHTLCSLGCAVIDRNVDIPENLMEKLLVSPLLGGSEAFENADAIIFSLLGGPELSLGDAKNVLELATGQLNSNFNKPVLLGAGFSDSLQGKMQLTALVVKYLDRKNELPEEKVPKQFVRKKIADHKDGTQMELPNLITEDKGIMENTVSVIINGEDLDIPAYKRKGIVLEIKKS